MKIIVACYFFVLITVSSWTNAQTYQIFTKLRVLAFYKSTQPNLTICGKCKYTTIYFYAELSVDKQCNFVFILILSMEHFHLCSKFKLKFWNTGTPLKLVASICFSYKYLHLLSKYTISLTLHVYWQINMYCTLYRHTDIPIKLNSVP